MPRKDFSSLPPEDNPSVAEQNTEPRPRRYTFVRSVISRTPKVYAVGFIPVFAAFSALFVICLVRQILTNGHAFDTFTQSNPYLAYILLYALPCLLCGIVFFFVLRRKKTVDTGIHPFSLSGVPFLILSAVLAVFLGTFLRFSAMYYFSAPSPVSYSLTAHSLPLAILCFAVIPAICEEFFFRGILFEEMTQTAGALVAVFVSAFTYALCMTDIRLFPTYFVLGLLYAVVAHVTSSVLPTVILRVFTDTLTLLFADRLRFIAAERIGNLFMLMLFAMFSLLFLILWFRSLETLCLKKAVSVSAGNAPSASEKKNTLYSFFRKPATLLPETGYPFHKLFRVLLSPALLLSAAAFLLVTLTNL